MLAARAEPNPLNAPRPANPFSALNPVKLPLKALSELRRSKAPKLNEFPVALTAALLPLKAPSSKVLSRPFNIVWQNKLA